MQAIALGAEAGRVDLRGAFRGTASGRYDAGGTRVAYESAEAVLRAQTLADFADLNARLTGGGVFGARRFQIKRGDVVVGDELRARHVELVVDGGSLTVNGRIDASGTQVGSIRLAAMRDLVINGMLDAHGAGLRVDSYGKIIDAPNRAVVELNSGQGPPRGSSTACNAARWNCWRRASMLPATRKSTAAGRWGPPPAMATSPLRRAARL
ncbi:hypothetical protein G6F62_013435 [Rhizopus arrhizus]|nr:hypothetical protein G6F62_013435 [Rhizopus arrhizus]